MRIARLGAALLAALLALAVGAAAAVAASEKPPRVEARAWTLIDARDGEVDNVTCGFGADTVQADAIDVVAKDCENVTTTGGSGSGGGGGGGSEVARSRLGASASATRHTRPTSREKK